MQIHRLYNQNPLRNFTYVIAAKDGEAYVVDPFEAGRVLGFVRDQGLRVKAVLNTHEHFDHVGGNEEIKRELNCEIWVHERALGEIKGATHAFSHDQSVALGAGCEMIFLDTPGHTFSHMCLLLKEAGKETALFTGDTLFNAGVGNCKNGGDPKALFASVDGLLAPLPDDVVIYPGHDYMENNLRFTLSLTPESEAAKLYLERTLELRKKGDFILTTMGEEKEINTFLRLEDKILREGLKMQTATNEEVFIKLRSLRDRW